MDMNLRHGFHLTLLEILIIFLAFPRNFALANYSDPNCLVYDQNIPDICLSCNSSNSYYRILLNPTKVICGFAQNWSEGTTCSFDNSIYQDLADIDQTQLKMSKWGSILQEDNYCLSQTFYDYPCLQYSLNHNFNWTAYNYQSAKFNFTSIRDQLAYDKVQFYCDQCQQGYQPYFGTISSLNISYIGCQPFQTCDMYSYQDPNTNLCLSCNSLFENCLSCNSTQCLQCPMGYYFNSEVYDFRTQSFGGKCIYGVCPQGYCTDIFDFQCILSQIDNCQICQDNRNYQTCNQCMEGFVLSEVQELCFLRTPSIDTRPRFVYSEQNLASINSSQNGLDLLNPSPSLHKIFLDLIQSLNNGTYSGASLTIFLFKGTHYLTLCTGSEEEAYLFEDNSFIPNICSQLDLYRTYTSVDNINITIQPLFCNIQLQNLTSQQQTIFNQNCQAEYSNVNLYVNSPYAYFNITGAWTFTNINFIGTNSLVRDPNLEYDFSIIPSLLCNITSIPDGKDGSLQVIESQIQGLKFNCQDSYQGTTFPEDITYVCSRNNNQPLAKQIESSYSCSLQKDQSDYWYQNPNGVYAKRQSTLFNLYTFSQNTVSQPQLSSLAIIACSFTYFYGNFESLINIEQSTLSQTTQSNKNFYFYNGMINGGNITILNSNFTHSRFCRGLIFSRKLTYDIDYSMSLVNLTLLGEPYPYLDYLKYQSIYIQSCNFINLNSYKAITSLAYFNGLPTYSVLRNNTYQPLYLLKPIHVGIVINVEDYPGSITAISCNFDKNMHYFAQYNNTITFQNEWQLLSSFIKSFDNETSEIKLGLCDIRQSKSYYLFGHGFQLLEGTDLENPFDMFERLTTIYISRPQGPILIFDSTFTNNIGTFGGAITINSPQWGNYPNMPPIVSISSNYFRQNTAYLSGNAIYVRSTVGQEDYLQYCGAGISIDYNSFLHNIGTKFGNGGALSHICTFLNSQVLEKSSGLVPDFDTEWITIKAVQLFASSPLVLPLTITLRLTTFTLSQNTFSQNFGGRKGSCVYIFQISNTTSINNVFYYNSAVYSYWEKKYSPFYLYLSQGIPFTFYDQIYGYNNTLDEYQFMLDKGYAMSGPSRGIRKFNQSLISYYLQYPSIKGALGLFYCETDDCVQSRTQVFSDSGSTWTSNDVGTLLIDNYSSDIAACVYVQGGTDIVFVLSNFLTHQSPLRLIDFTKENYVYNQDLNIASAFSQSSLIIYSIGEPTVTKFTEYNITFEDCIFQSNYHFQMYDFQNGNTLYSSGIFYRGSLIRLITSDIDYQELDYNFVATLTLSNTTMIDNFMIGDWASNVVILNGLLHVFNCTLAGNGYMYNDIILQDFGVFDMRLYTHYDISKYYNYLDSTIVYFSLCKRGGLFNVFGNNLRFDISNNVFSGLASRSLASLLLYDYSSVPYSTSVFIITNNYVNSTFGTVFYFQDDEFKTFYPPLIILEGNYFQKVRNFNDKASVLYVKNSQGVLCYNTTVVDLFLSENEFQNYLTYLQSKYTKTSVLGQQRFQMFWLTYYGTSPDQYLIKIDNSEPQNYTGTDQTYINFLANVENQFLQHIQDGVFTWGTVILSSCSFIMHDQQRGIIQAIGTYVYLENYNVQGQAYAQSQILSYVYAVNLIDISEGGYLYARNIDFEMNQGFSNESVLISLDGISSCEMYNVNFNNNRFTQSSIVYVNRNSQFSCINCSFANNYVYDGIINSLGNNIVTLQNCLFESNNGLKHVIFSSESFLNIQNSYFIDMQGQYIILLINSTLAFAGNQVGQSLNTNLIDKSFIYLAQNSSSVIDYSNFNNVRGTASSIVYASYGSNVNITNSLISNCIADSPQAGVLYFMNTINNISIFNTSFVNNQQIDINSENSNLNISNSLFNLSLINSIRVKKASLILTNSVFINQRQSLSQNGSVFCNCQDMLITKNTFKNLIGIQNGGALYITNYTEGSFIIQQNNFINNTAEQGGAIYVQQAAYLQISRNIFQNNSASESAGALYLNSLKAINSSKVLTTIVLTQNQFLNNFAGIQGGAILIVTNKTNIIDSTNVFSGNYAPYGPDYGSYPKYINLTSTQINISTTGLSSEVIKFDVESGQPVGFTIQLYDQMNFIYTANILSQAIIYSQDSSSSIVFKNNRVFTNNGFFDFSNMAVLFDPGSSISLNIEFIGVQDYGNTIGFIQKPISIQLQARNCVLGEEWVQNGTCIYCPEGSYILKVPTNITLCQDCPVGGNCTGGSSIMPAEGYQRSSQNFTLFIECPFSGSCITGTPTNPNGTCALGYEGILCAQCIKGYYKLYDNTCHQCTSTDSSQYSLVIVFVLLVTIAFLMAQSTIQRSNQVRPVYNVYIKIFTNYIQISGTISSIDFHLPEMIKQLFSLNTYFFSISNQLYQVQCATKNARYIDDMPYYYLKLVLMAILPIILIIFVVVFWVCFYLFNKSRNRPNNQTLNNAISTIVIFLYLIHPDLSQTLFSAFNCTYIDGKIRLKNYIQDECYTGRHLLYLQAVVIPGIICWIFGIPLLFSLGMYKYKQGIETIKEEEDALKRQSKLVMIESLRMYLGFLFNGYRTDLMYWEIRVMLRKTFIIMGVVFLSTVSPESQFLVVSLIVFIEVRSQILQLPFFLNSLNIMETLQLIANLSTLYFGVFYVSGYLWYQNLQSQSYQASLFFFIVLPNVLFMIYWLYQMRIELLKELFKRKQYKILSYLLCEKVLDQNRFYAKYLAKDLMLEKQETEGAIQIKFLDVDLHSKKYNEISNKVTTKFQNNKDFLGFLSNLNLQRRLQSQIKSKLARNILKSKNNIRDLSISEQIEEEGRRDSYEGSFRLQRNQKFIENIGFERDKAIVDFIMKRQVRRKKRTNEINQDYS